MVLLLAAGLVGAAVNAVASEGTFITFPAFLSTEVAAVIANTSNATAIWPGRLLAIASYRRELDRQLRRALWTGAVSLLGGLAGAWLLLRSSDAGFLAAVPWLILLATLLLILDKSLSKRFAISDVDSKTSVGKLLLVSAALFICAAYGSFFGGGLGVMLLPILSMTGVKDMQELKGLKNLLVTVITGVGVVTYIAAGTVSWLRALAMMASAVIGGYYGGELARRLPSDVLRLVIIVFGFSLSTYSFVR